MLWLSLEKGDGYRLTTDSIVVVDNDSIFSENDDNETIVIEDDEPIVVGRCLYLDAFNSTKRLLLFVALVIVTCFNSCTFFSYAYTPILRIKSLIFWGEGGSKCNERKFKLRIDFCEN